MSTFSVHTHTLVRQCFMAVRTQYIKINRSGREKNSRRLCIINKRYSPTHSDPPSLIPPQTTCSFSFTLSFHSFALYFLFPPLSFLITPVSILLISSVPPPSRPPVNVITPFLTASNVPSCLHVKSGKVGAQCKIYVV